jgi:ParB family chromosome partitioning protein
VLLGDQGADLGLGLERIPDLERLRALGEAADELVVERLLDQDARSRLAALAGGVVDRPHRARDRVVEVRVREDEVRALAAELEREALDRVGAKSHDLRARRRRAGERDLVHAGVLDEVGADRLPLARNDVDRAGWEADLGGQLGHAQGGQRRRRVRLENDRATGGQRRSELPGRHHQRVVPRHDLTRDPHGLLQRVEEERAPDRVRATGDGADRGGVEAEVLDSLSQLCLYRRERLADVAHLELSKLLAVRLDGIGESVQEA